MFCGEGEGLTDWTVEENKVIELRMEGWGGRKGRMVRMLL